MKFYRLSPMTMQQLRRRPTNLSRQASPFPCENPSRRSGVVLLLVLVLILVSSLSVAGFARKSLQLVQTVADAQESLQRRWGARSCQRFLLANAERLLNGGSQSEGAERSVWPLPKNLSAEIPLGNFRFRLRLADEEAKSNLNMLLQRDLTSQTLLSNNVQQASSASGLMTLVRLPTGDAATPNRVALQTWEQVFDLHSADEAARLAEQLQSATGEITCWGSGKLNLRRASDDTVRIVCEGQVGERTLANVLAKRRAGSFRDLESLLRQVELKPKEEAALKRLLSVNSQCHSVWLTIQGNRRSWTLFTVDRSGKGNPASFETFSW